MVSVTESANEKRKIQHLCAGRPTAQLSSPQARSLRQLDSKSKSESKLLTHFRLHHTSVRHKVAIRCSQFWI